MFWDCSSPHHFLLIVILRRIGGSSVTSGEPHIVLPGCKSRHQLIVYLWEKNWQLRCRNGHGKMFRYFLPWLFTWFLNSHEAGFFIKYNHLFCFLCYCIAVLFCLEPNLNLWIFVVGGWPISVQPTDSAQIQIWIRLIQWLNSNFQIRSLWLSCPEQVKKKKGFDYVEKIVQKLNQISELMSYTPIIIRPLIQSCYIYFFNTNSKKRQDFITSEILSTF